MAWTTPKTWTDNVDVLSATNLNTHLRDNLNAAATWVAYTPTWSATGGTPVLGNGTLDGWHITIGDSVRVRVKLTLGSTSSVGTTTVWQFTLPSTVDSNWYGLGTAAAWDDSTTTLNAAGHAYAGPSADYVRAQFTGGTWIGYSNPLTWATGDVLLLHVEYVKQ